MLKDLGKIGDKIIENMMTWSHIGFNALNWSSQLLTHIPNKGDRMARYYGQYLNKARDMHQKAGCDNNAPTLIESPLSSTAWRKKVRRLIHKLYFEIYNGVDNSL